MSPGPLLLLAILLGIAVVMIVQFRRTATSRARQGTPVGPLPEPFATEAEGEALWWFHSPTCGPCRRMHPAVEALQAHGRIRAIDVSTNLPVAHALSVMATPTTVLVRRGRVVAVRVGPLSPDALDRLAPGGPLSAG